MTRVVHRPGRPVTKHAPLTVGMVVLCDGCGAAVKLVERSDNVGSVWFVWRRLRPWEWVKYRKKINAVRGAEWAR